jgi:tetratricopeptide (TPR) repeat protein
MKAIIHIGGSLMRLVSHPVKSRKLLLFGVTFCVGLLYALIHAAYGQEITAGRIVSKKGQVLIYSPKKGIWEDAAVNQSIDPGSTIRTGEDGWAAVLLNDETLLQLNRNTQFHLKKVASNAGWYRMRGIVPAAGGQSGRSVYSVDSGEIWFRNKNLKTGIEVETPTVSAGIRGTEVNLLITPDQAVFLSVLEGHVLARNEKGAVEAGAREQIFVKPGAPPQKRILLFPQDAVQWTISVPALIDYRSMPLMSFDHAVLIQERDRLQTAIAKGEKGIDSLVRLGDVLRDLGHLDQAAAMFEKVLRTAPKDNRALTGLGWVELDSGKPEEALVWFTMVKDPLPMTYLGRSVAYAQRVDWENARVILREGTSQYPDFPPFFVQNAMIYLGLGNLKGAEDVLKQTIKRHPDYGLGWSALSLVKQVLGEKTLAMDAARKGVELSPEVPSAHIIMSYAFQAAFNLKQALESINRALALDDRNVTALLNRARLLFGSGYRDIASKDVEKAQELDPGNGEVHNLKGFLLLARRKTDKAISAFKEALRMNADLGEPHLGLALAYMRKADVAVAMEEMTTAVLLEPRRSLFLSYWAKMLYQIHRFDKALDMLTLAQEMDPRDPTPYLYKGIILRDLNRPVEAVSSFNKAVALNDNRAVYRSRFLLDQDLAVENINLSILYSQLGLESWATNKAMASIKEDYTNFAGHLFLGNALLGTGNRTIAGGSESLLARIMQPANENAVNTFNEYTPFIERPSINGVLEGSLGNHDTNSADLITYGAIPDMNLAFNVAGFYSSTDGWRDTNNLRSKSVAGLFKFDPTPKDRISLSPRYLETTLQDASFSQFEYDAPDDPFDRNEVRSAKIEVGHYHHFSPGSDLLLFFTSVDDDVNLYNHNKTENVFSIPGLNYEEFLESSIQRPYNQAQGQYLFKYRDHQLIFGTVHYWGDNNSDSTLRNYFEFSGIVLFPESTQTLVNSGQSLHSYYMEDIWKLRSNFVVELAVYYDDMKNSNAFTGADWDVREFEPRIGFIWHPTSSDTLRLTGFRYVLPFTSNRIDPMDIAGVPIFRNALEGSVAEEADFVWEHEWSSGFLSINPFYLSREYDEQLVKDDPSSRSTWKSRFKGAEIRVNQIIYLGLAMSGVYNYNDVHDENDPSIDREENLLTGSLNYIHPSGFSAAISQTYRSLNFKNPGRSNEDIWITDAGLGYELPRKRGRFSVLVRNLFDNHFNWVVDNFTLTGKDPDREILVTLSLYF